MRPPQNHENPPQDGDYIAWLDEIWARSLRKKTATRPSLVVGILVSPGFAMMSLTGIIESLRHAGDEGDRSRQIECQWEILGQTEVPVRSSCGIQVTPSCDYPNPHDLDYVFVIGGLLDRLGETPAAHRRYLHAAKAAQIPLVGVCTGVFILGEERLLAGHRACIHPYHRGDFTLAFPGHSFSTQDDYLIDGDVITVPGGTSILSLMTTLIRNHMGVDRASKAVHQLSLTDWRGVGDFERTGLMRHLEVRDPRIQKALVLIDDGRRENLKVPALAAQLGMSERHFSRLFQEQIGDSPKTYILNTRLRYCQWLLHNSANSITSIAYAGGFSSCSHFSTAFRKEFGISPQEARQKK